MQDLTVEELIGKLNKLNLNAKVKIYISNSGDYTIKDTAIIDDDIYLIWDC